MRRTRTVGLALVVVLAISALSVATAAAEPPEFGRCAKVAKATGKFSSATCTIEKVGGSFEWIPGVGAGNKFTTAVKAGTIMTLAETVGGTKITCTGGTGVGEYTGTKTVGSVLLTFTNCETSAGKVESTGQPEGRVVTKPLQGGLGVEKVGETTKKNKIGLDLFPENGTIISEMHCAGLPIVLGGSVISHSLTANKMLLTSTVKYVEAKGKQKPEHFAGEPNDVLEADTNGGPFEQAAWAQEITQTNEEPIEINSVF